MRDTITNHSFIYNVITEKCPNCKNGNAFRKTQGVFSLPQMKEKCENCHYKFEREPGYFIGAMYVSYGLAIAQGLFIFILSYILLPNLPAEWILIMIILFLLLASKKNYKLSRILYLYLFPQ